MLIFNPIQDLYPSDTNTDKKNPMKRIQVIIQTPTADRQTDGRLLVWTNEQTHNMMQVWTGKLSELQLPVQNPAREGACTSMSY